MASLILDYNQLDRGKIGGVSAADQRNITRNPSLGPVADLLLDRVKRHRESEISGLDGHIKDRQRAILRYKKDRLKIRAQIRELAKQRDPVIQDIRQALMEHAPLISDFAIRGKDPSTLMILTTPITLRPGTPLRDFNVKKHPIHLGRFLIQFTLSHTINPRNIKIFNIHFSYGSYDHPNIQNGEVCWGQAQSGLNGAIARLEFGKVIDACMGVFGDYGNNPHINWRDWYNRRSARTNEMLYPGHSTYIKSDPEATGVYQPIEPIDLSIHPFMREYDEQLVRDRERLREAERQRDAYTQSIRLRGLREDGTEPGDETTTTTRTTTTSGEYETRRQQRFNNRAMAARGIWRAVHEADSTNY